MGGQAVRDKNSDPEAFTFLSNLANSLQTRFELTAATDDLDRAVHLNETALQSLPDGHPGTFMILSNLRNALRQRSEFRGSNDDLDRALL